jgi:16S rRNA (guanine527-N7)-methyltransferase
VPDTDPSGDFPAALLDVLAEARAAGFLGPGPLEPHLRHAEGFAALARRQPVALGSGPPRLLDLGSGGGLPGLVVAVRWPAATLVLLDGNERRTDFLVAAVRHCELDERVTVVHQRAEVAGRDPARRGTFDGVVVRSFGPPAVVAECAAPFLRVGGWLIVSEPPRSAPGGAGSDPEPSRWPPEELAQVGLEPVAPVRDEFGYQVLTQREICPGRFPRRDGVPTKNPIF